MPWTLAQLANHVNAELKGNADVEIYSVATLMGAGKGQISFFTNRKYREQLKTTSADAVILHPDFANDCPTNAILVNNPYATYARIAQLMYPVDAVQAGIHPSAQIAKDVTIAEGVLIGANAVIDDGTTLESDVQIGANVYVGKNCKIGQNSRILANATICDGVSMGKRVLIHPGAVIGADGFGEAYDEGKWIKVPQIGTVRIGDDVEIGANTTIDCGAIDDTVIEDGVKLDNQIQIGHNARVGAHTVIAAATAVAGSTTIGRNCMIAGAVAIAGHITIADNVTVTGMTMVSKSIPEAGSQSSGISSEDTAIWQRLHARIKQLDGIAKRLQNVEKKLKKT